MLTLFYHHILSFWVQQHPHNDDETHKNEHHHDVLHVHPPESWTCIFTSACWFLYSSACHAWEQSHLLLLTADPSERAEDKEPPKVIEEQTIGNPLKDIVTLLAREGFAKADNKASSFPPLTRLDDHQHDSDDDEEEEHSDDSVKKPCKAVHVDKHVPRSQETDEDSLLANESFCSSVEGASHTSSTVKSSLDASCAFVVALLVAALAIHLCKDESFCQNKFDPTFLAVKPPIASKALSLLPAGEDAPIRGVVNMCHEMFDQVVLTVKTRSVASDDVALPLVKARDEHRISSAFAGPFAFV